VRAARRLRDFTVRRILKIPVRCAKSLEFQFHTQKALPLRSKATTTRDPPSQKKDARAEEKRRSCVRLFYGALRILVVVRVARSNFLWHDSVISIRRPKDGLDIRKNISLAVFTTSLNNNERGNHRRRKRTLENGLENGRTKRRRCLQTTFWRSTKTLKRNIFSTHILSPGTKDTRHALLSLKRL